MVTNGAGKPPNLHLTKVGLLLPIYEYTTFGDATVLMKGLAKKEKKFLEAHSLTGDVVI